MVGTCLKASMLFSEPSVHLPESELWPQGMGTLVCGLRDFVAFCFSKCFLKLLLLRLLTLPAGCGRAQRQPWADHGDLEEVHCSFLLHKGGNHLLNSPHKLSRLLWISLLIHLDTLSCHFRAVDTSSHFQPFQCRETNYAFPPALRDMPEERNLQNNSISEAPVPFILSLSLWLVA